MRRLNDMKRLRFIFCIFNLFVIFLLVKTGFVVEASANPVSLLLSEADNCYKLTVYLNSDIQMNAFQFKLDFDNKNIDIISNVDFYCDFLKEYNGNNGAMLKCRYNENKSNVIFLGVQTDNACAFVNKNTVISEILFKPHAEDVGEIAKQLDSIVMTIEVIEGLDGNIVSTDSEWTLYANRRNNGNSNEYSQGVADEDVQGTVQGTGAEVEDIQVTGGQDIGAGSENRQGETVQGTGSEDVKGVSGQDTAAVGKPTQGSLAEQSTGAVSGTTQESLVQGTGAESESTQDTLVKNEGASGKATQGRASDDTKRLLYIFICFSTAAVIVIAVVYVCRRIRKTK